MRAATVMRWLRMVAPRAFAWNVPASAPAARVRLWDMAAQVAQAAFAANEPDIGRVAARFDLDEHARTVLAGMFEMLNWYATSSLACAAYRTASATYYDKLVAAAERPGLAADDEAALRRAIDYVDGHAQDQVTRSAVLSALAADLSLEPRWREEIRATVSSAWMTAMSEGSSGSVSLTMPLPYGVMIPRILDEPAEAFVDIENLDRVLTRNPVLRVEDSIAVNMAWLSWHQVADVAESTRTTRDLVTQALDDGMAADPEIVAVYRRAVKRALQKTFPPLTRAEFARFTVNLVSAGVAHGSVIRFAGPAMAAGEAVKSSFRWTKGRFIAGTLNRLADRISPDNLPLP